MSSQKVVNDPVYGFISIDDPFILELIDHRYFQRLRRIKQLGLTDLVYPGATHTRFAHALGAYHLMKQSIATLRSKGNQINKDEERGLLCAILLHDIGHGPFSHALEHSIFQGVHHEKLSIAIMEQVNDEFNGQLDLCISIFKGQYHRKFMSQLVSSQLDVDRLDYLNRDTYFSGVSEGIIGWDRIIKMLEVHNDELMVADKGIHSLEKFLIARRIMYWQVYLHKTATAAEMMLISTLSRARSLVSKGKLDCCQKSLQFFLDHTIGPESLTDPVVIQNFCALDDIDILTELKYWKASSGDQVLEILCDGLLNRKLFKLRMQEKPISSELKLECMQHLKEKLHLLEEDLSFLILSGTLSNTAYQSSANEIVLVNREGEQFKLSDRSDILGKNWKHSSTTKHYLCIPESISDALVMRKKR